MEPPKVQHVTKASSDELLRKFAPIDDDEDDNIDTETARKSSAKRRRTVTTKTGRKKKSKVHDEEHEEENENENDENCNVMNNNGSLSLRVVEKKSLLCKQKGKGKRSSSGGNKLLRKMGISRKMRSNNKSVLGAIEKTWNKALRGASEVFMDKHYNRHRLLISDSV